MESIEELRHAHEVAEAKASVLQDALAEAHDHSDKLMALWKKADKERMEAAQKLIEAMREL